MTGKERITNILQRKPTDRIGLYEHFWPDTYNEWRNNQGCGEDFNAEFGFDIVECGCMNFMARLDFNPVTVSEDEDTVTQLDGNYATLRRHKKHDTTPEHIGFEVNTRAKWEELVKPLLTDDAILEKRIHFDGYRSTKKYAGERNLFFTFSCLNVFECMHPVAGHEEMLAAMIYDPDWICDMCDTYAEMILKAMKLLFEREGMPDAVWFYEDMGYKGAPFMSPKMYNDIIYPAHRKTFGYVKSLGLPVIVHSCGYVEPLIDGLLRAGMDALNVIEVKAGMDLLRLYQKYGERLSFIGGIDVRELYTNDRKRIDIELEAKIPVVMQGNGYVVHSDHSIPATVNYEVYKYFCKKALELGTYK